MRLKWDNMGLSVWQGDSGDRLNSLRIIYRAGWHGICFASARVRSGHPGGGLVPVVAGVSFRPGVALAAGPGRMRVGHGGENPGSTEGGGVWTFAFETTPARAGRWIDARKRRRAFAAGRDQNLGPSPFHASEPGFMGQTEHN